jgi:hypothetical protein
MGRQQAAVGRVPDQPAGAFGECGRGAMTLGVAGETVSESSGQRVPHSLQTARSTRSAIGYSSPSLIAGRRLVRESG